MIYKFQQGGAAPQGGASQQEQIMQAIAIGAMITGDAQDEKQAALIAQQVMVGVLQLNLQAIQAAQKYMQAYQQYAQQQSQQQATMARNGSKLDYIHNLRTGCPSGQQPKYFKIGGKTTRVCMACAGKSMKAEQGAEIQENKCGGKAKKLENGGKKRVYFDKCGKKMKK